MAKKKGNRGVNFLGVAIAAGLLYYFFKPEPAAASTSNNTQQPPRNATDNPIILDFKPSDVNLNLSLDNAGIPPLTITPEITKFTPDKPLYAKPPEPNTPSIILNGIKFN